MRTNRNNKALPASKAASDDLEVTFEEAVLQFESEYAYYLDKDPSTSLFHSSEKTETFFHWLIEENYTDVVRDVYKNYSALLEKEWAAAAIIYSIEQNNLPMAKIIIANEVDLIGGDEKLKQNLQKTAREYNQPEILTELDKAVLAHESKKLAIEATRYALKFIRQSWTHPDTQPHDLPRLKGIVNQMRRDTFDEDQSVRDLFIVPEIHVDQALYYAKHNIKMLSKFAAADPSRKTIGNCQECVYLALNYIRKEANKLAENNIPFAEEWRAEAVSILGDDHIFFVINRAPNSDITNPASWGEYAYICNPWALASENKSKSFDVEDFLYRSADDYDPIKKTFTRLQCYEYSDGKNVLYPYEAKIHKLGIELSIGGIDVISKHYLVVCAMSNLWLVTGEIRKIIAQFPADTLKYQRLLEEITVDLGKMAASKDHLIHDGRLNVILERELSAIIRCDLKALQRLAGRLGYKKLVNDGLIASWLTNLSREESNWKVYWHILTTHAHNVVFPLLDHMDITLTKKLVTSHIFDYSLLYLVAIRGDSIYFDRLLEKLTSDNLHQLAFKENNGKKIINRKRLLSVVLENLGTKYFIKLVDRIVDDQQSSAGLDDAIKKLYTHSRREMDIIATTDLFIQALSKNEFATAKHLLKFSIDINREDSQGRSLIACAIEKNRKDIVLSLLGRGGSSKEAIPFLFPDRKDLIAGGDFFKTSSTKNINAGKKVNPSRIVPSKKRS